MNSVERAGAASLTRRLIQDYAQSPRIGVPVRAFVLFASVRVAETNRREGRNRMLIDRIAATLGQAPSFARISEMLAEGKDAALATPGLVRPALVAALYARRPRPTFVVVPGADAADRFRRQMAALLGEERVLSMPRRLDFPWTEELPDPRVVGRRARAMYSMEKGLPLVVVASARSLLRVVPPQGSRVYHPINFVVGETLDLDETSSQLVAMGYERLDSALEPATFAIRGGTLDVFGAEQMQPVRVDLFGDQIESIRRFIPGSGQVVRSVDGASVFPCRAVRLSGRGADAIEDVMKMRLAHDTELREHVEKISAGQLFPGVERYLPLLFKRPGTFAEYLHSKTLVVAAEPRAIVDDATRWYEELMASAKAHDFKQVVPGGPLLNGLYFAPEELDFGERQRLTLLALTRSGGIPDAELVARRPEVTGGEERFVGTIRSLASKGESVVIAVPDRRARMRIGDALAEAGVPVVRERDRAGASAEDAAASDRRALESGWVLLSDVEVPSGFVVPEAKLAVVSVDDIFPRSALRRARRQIDPTQVTFAFAPGDYVVHATHGIALFKEVVRQTVLGAERDYLLLIYAKGDKLFVPMEQVDRLTRYVGPEGSAPRVTRLNTADWSKATGKARVAAKKLAFDLVDLYARRSTVTGNAYGPDTPWQLEMEAMFPFEETPDQLAAIADVKADMESEKPMDRLICGDVGYGKTEVAIRAAFKAANDGKQVMVLCPTTILAQQHYTNFSERFEPFGIGLEVLSRFRSDAQQKAALEGFSAGDVMVLVGTHRLLSRDVIPKDLGLVIIDEEQRFGVEHKEHMKNLREQVDILTLSATPIPRTLQMSLSGVRDMSVIDTPPPNRFPIQVQVGEWDEDIVSGAIRREVERGGQIYYVSNRVKSIDDAVQRVLLAAPEARVAVAHGQMGEKQLEDVMERFAANEVDVLIATTIIESGIDNPHTNTLIIEDSQRLGLAQLYQLKGRVGRSHVRAFAYFLFPRESALTEQAIERLSAIKEHDDLGSGIRIAMRDLEIRGAGSLLGAEQSGNLSAVGFDLFAQMLMEAVSEARGEPVVAHSDIRVDLPVSVFLPEEYVEAVDDRVRFYRRLAGSPTVEAVEAIAAELSERYGALPVPARNLVDVARVKARAADVGVTSVTVVRSRLTLSPVRVEDEVLGRAQAMGAVFTERKHELTYPVGYGESVVAAALGILSAIYSPESINPSGRNAG